MRKPSCSRGVDETFWANVDEDIIEKGCSQTATNRSQDRGPNPVLVTVGEHCESKPKDALETTTKRIKTAVPLRPYPTIAVMMRGPRSRAGLIANPIEEIEILKTIE
jgi:hypothetical protein